MMNILITGVAGFIGSSLVKRLITGNNLIVGVDNLNEYYDIKLKYDRLKSLGINSLTNLRFYEKNNFLFYRCDLTDSKELEKIFSSHNFDLVINLAAQAGVRYSFEEPKEYINSNILGFFNVLELSKKYGVKDLIYASSSSVYGNLDVYPALETEKTSSPESLYAASKKTNELFGYFYSKNFNLNCVGLRFFTVYGPFGRPDMATYIFTKSILSNNKIYLFNKGEVYRDFTFIDDTIQGIEIVIENISILKNEIINIGYGKSISVINMIETMESIIGIKANKIEKSMQKGDVYKTHSSIEKISSFGYSPKFSFEQGYKEYYRWFKKYYSEK